MAVFIQRDVSLLFGATDVSDHVVSCTLNQQFDEVENTAAVPTSTTLPGHSFQKGLESATLNVDLYNDTAASVLALLQTNYGSTIGFTLKNSSAATSATNPKYTGNVLINRLTPVSGKVGDVSIQSLQLTVVGGVTYAIV